MLVPQRSWLKGVYARYIYNRFTSLAPKIIEWPLMTVIGASATSLNGMDSAVDVCGGRASCWTAQNSEEWSLFKLLVNIFSTNHWKGQCYQNQMLHENTTKFWVSLGYRTTLLSRSANISSEWEVFLVSALFIFLSDLVRALPLRHHWWIWNLYLPNLV